MESDMELRSLVRRWRGRLKPHDVGLPAAGRRRAVGLRREEVAELAGISSVWYTRFETGRAQLSFSALRRVADALRLAGDERRRLLDLARPDLRVAGEWAAGDGVCGIGSRLDGLRDLARACTTASTLGELGAAATRAVHTLSGDDVLAYMRELDSRSGDLRNIGACGSGSEALIGHCLSSASVAYAMADFTDGRSHAEIDLRQSPCIELRARVRGTGVMAYHSQPIMGRNGLQFLLGIALREARRPDALQISGLQAVAAIVELTLNR